MFQWTISQMTTLLNLTLMDPSDEVTEENKKAAYLLKAKAMEAIIDGTLLPWLFTICTT